MRFLAPTWLLGALLWVQPVPGQTAEDFFDDTVLHEIRLWVHPADWERLKTNYLENTCYPAELEWRGVVAYDVGIRSRGFVNAASLQPELAPGALVSLFGRNLAPEDGLAGAVSLPVELGGIRSFANGNPLPLLFVSPVQINAQLPFDLDGAVEVRIDTANGSVGIGAPLRACTPGIFALTHSDGRLVSEEAPAQRGAHLVLYASLRSAQAVSNRISLPLASPS